MSRRGQRVVNVPAYLLHATAWRETSLVVQVFAREHGVVAMVAKGAKRPHSVLRPVLNAFQPLSLSWSGAGEVKTLTRAESAGIQPLRGRAFMSAWYMNELLLRLLPREDAHPVLFDAYEAALAKLVAVGQDRDTSLPISGLLRQFEWALLQETGYGFDEPMPDFADADIERQFRPVLRERLDELLGRPLQTRKVLMELYR
ncbi:MAG TPA: DNA repair protein RecO [Burkholderiaceae bacterium]|nr:DNA repair protein RecO [Burkholderiaceae bacterium]